MNTPPLNLGDTVYLRGKVTRIWPDGDITIEHSYQENCKIKPRKTTTLVSNLHTPNTMIKVKVKLDPGAKMPQRAHDTDVGYDIRALNVDVAYRRNGKENIIWKVFIDTGVHITPPDGYYCELVPNSRLAKTPFHYGNSIGIIDPGYTGSIRAILTCEFNVINEDLIPKPGDVIGQLIIRRHHEADFEQVEELENTERGDGGFGSTARKEQA